MNAYLFNKLLCARTVAADFFEQLLLLDTSGGGDVMFEEDPSLSIEMATELFALTDEAGRLILAEDNSLIISE